MIFDGLQNVLAGLGTSRDKSSGASYALDVLDALTLHNAYIESALIRRAIDLPAEDSVREWRAWQAEADQISAIEAEEARLGLQGKLLHARRLARLFGGAAIFIANGDEDIAEPMDLDRIGIGGIDYLTVMSRGEIHGHEVDLDPSSQTFGQPRIWRVVGSTRGAVDIHPSRLVVLHGTAPMRHGVSFQSDGFGHSTLQGMLQQLRRVDEVAANINSLVYEAKIDVVKIPDLMANLATRGPGFEAEVMKRMRLAMSSKSINGSLILDGEEDYQQKSASFGGLPQVLDRTMQVASAFAGIPMALLFGRSVGGLNATGENDTRAYYDRVRVEQTMNIEPALRNLDEAIIRSALGSRPPDVHFNWRSLWQISEKDRADIADKLMAAAEKLDRLEVIPPEAIGQAAVNALTESGAFPGLESAVNEANEVRGDDEDFIPPQRRNRLEDPV
ncbi:MAG: DUF1073 domain-containing protein [Roseovarius sp.]|nr:DUF1073 domain-containing protein [Roseovarius sp.]